MTTQNQPDQTAPPALDGITVLDFSRVLAGPWATLNLADLGAEIIKIENPDGGDDSRNFERVDALQGDSAYFPFVNRNKLSLALDFSTPSGCAVARKLAAKADILIENFRPGVMQRRGLDYETLREQNPGLIYCAISGYGHDSPYRDLPGYDPVAQAESGMMSYNGEPGGAPLRTGVSYGDMFAGMYAAQAILAALHARGRDGLGQFIDIALLDTAVAMTANLAQRYFITGDNAERVGNSHHFLEPVCLFDTKDGLISLIIGNERQWERFCKDVIDRPDLLDDPRFATNADRMQHRAETRELLGTILRQDTRENWVRKFRKAGVPAGAVREVGEALTSPEVEKRGLIHEVAHPVAGSIQVVGTPMRLSRTPAAKPAPAPALGQQSVEILRRFGYSDRDIAALRADRAIPAAED
jgi:crotonobetainyl-CoA:carnitine CoA-transferase CaiB-like acyl-CoA transferase